LASVITCILGVPGVASAAEPDVVRGLQWQIAKLRLNEVHTRATGAGIVVAIVDSGVDAGHPDLAGQVLQSPEIRANMDVDGRGTGLAGLIAGHGHSSSPPPSPPSPDSGDAGILGVAPGAKILPVAFAPSFAEVGSPDDMATGIELAVNRGAKIICIGRSISSSERLQFAIDVAAEKGVLVITGDSSTWPASYPGVLTAIPADRNGEVRVAPASGRTTGIVVPGYELMTTDRAGGYRFADSSGSAAILAGAAAVVWSANPDAKAAQIMNLLRSTTTDRGASGPDAQFGAGELDLLRALKTGVPQPAASASPTASPSKELPPKPSAVRPLLDSTDWRRWLVVTPLVLFFVALAFWSYRSARD
jgi:subtilisin family serine protease